MKHIKGMRLFDWIDSGVGISVLCIVLVVLNLGIFPREAVACSCGYPSGGWTVPENGLLPSNARGIVGWYQAGVFEEEDDIDGLYKTVTVWEIPSYGEPQPVPVKIELLGAGPESLGKVEKYSLYRSYLVTPRGFEGGKRYRVTFQPLRHSPWDFHRAMPPKEAEVEVSFEPVETGSSRLKVTGNDQGGISVAAGMSCSTGIQAHSLTMDLELPLEARRWDGVLHYLTFVDGEPWTEARSACQFIAPGRSWVELGTDKIYTKCRSEDSEVRSWAQDGLSAGSREVQMIAWLPGTDLLFSASRTVELGCKTVTKPEAL